MDFLAKLISSITGNQKPAPPVCATPSSNALDLSGDHPSDHAILATQESDATKSVQKDVRVESIDPPHSATVHAQELGFTVTISGSFGPASVVSDAEVAARVKEHEYVLLTDPPALRTADQWWEEETHKRRIRDGSKKMDAWLQAFLPIEAVMLESLRKAQQRGPYGAAAIAKELRALIREQRKQKQSHTMLLHALFGASVVTDFLSALAVRDLSLSGVTRFVDINELQAADWSYSTLGYRRSASLSKTDIKWLVEAFGEPDDHQAFDSLFPHIRRNAVSRCCWAELRKENDTSARFRRRPRTMQDWLNELTKRSLGYQKDWQAQNAARSAFRGEQDAALDAMWAATQEIFVVADLETTGLNSATDEVLEFAALVVAPSGAVIAEFSALVYVNRPIPALISDLTGITQEMIDREGIALADAMVAFQKFVGAYPIFFHNAPFDTGFLQAAATQTRRNFTNPVHDTLPMAWAVWPALGSHKLSALAEHVGAAAPTHRGLADAKTTLSVLLAARTMKCPPATCGQP